MRERGDGETTRQMQAAPQGAVFVCPNITFARVYGRALARQIGREDLQLVGPEWFDREGNWQGRDLPGLVFDHAVALTDRQYENSRWALYRVRAEE